MPALETLQMRGTHAELVETRNPDVMNTVFDEGKYNSEIPKVPFLTEHV